MSCQKFSFAGGQYESPAFEMIDYALDTALLSDSVSSSLISPYEDDTTLIDL